MKIIVLKEEDIKEMFTMYDAIKASKEALDYPQMDLVIYPLGLI